MCIGSIPVLIRCVCDENPHDPTVAWDKICLPAAQTQANAQ